MPEAHLNIPEAVVSFARAVLGEGGQLVFGGHPTVSALLADLASEYSAPPPLESERPDEQDEPHVPAIIYQSKVFRRREDAKDNTGFVPEETRLMERLGFAEVHWTPVKNNERYDPNVRDRPQCPESLRLMRERMIRDTEPAAMVVIGGMEGVPDEVGQFLEFAAGRRIFVLPSTGGAALELADQQFSDRIIVPPSDRKFLSRLRDHQGDEGPPVPPYPLIMQQIVDEISG